MRILLLALLFLFEALVVPATAQDAAGLNKDRLDKLIRGLEGVSGDIESEPGFWMFEYLGRPVYVVIDPASNWLQVLAPIVPVAKLNQATLVRTLTANFSATNEARYAIAKNLLWSVYANAVTALTEAEFIASLKQVVVTAKKFPSLIVVEKSKPAEGDGETPGGVEVIRPGDNKS